MRSTHKHINSFIIVIIIAAASCTATPDATPSAQASNTNTNGIIAATDAPMLTETATPTATPTITLTPTPPPDVELAQLQVVDETLFIAEIINHLSVPVVFEDQQPAIRFDVYDPILDMHLQGYEPVDRYNEEWTSVPCVIFPGETAFYEGSGWAGERGDILGDWYYMSNHAAPDQLQITYQTLAVPRPDWPDKSRKYTVSDVKWDIEGETLIFSFKHAPYHVTYGHVPFNQGTMGLYDKDNRILGVASGPIRQTLDTGIADGYSAYFDPALGLSSTKPWGYTWKYIGPEDAKTRVDHIAIMIEILPGVDGTCVREPSTATPKSG